MLYVLCVGQLISVEYGFIKKGWQIECWCLSARVLLVLFTKVALVVRLSACVLVSVIMCCYVYSEKLIIADIILSHEICRKGRSLFPR